VAALFAIPEPPEKPFNRPNATNILGAIELYWLNIVKCVVKRRQTNMYDMNFIENILGSMERSNSLPPMRRRGVAKKPSVAVRKPYRASERASNYEQHIMGQYFHMRRACAQKMKRAQNAEKWAWLISPMEWVELWATASPIPLGDGSFAPAHTKRGRNPQTDVQLRRKDTGKPWTKDNMDVMYKGQSLLAEQKLNEM
jgi:hypothetical protein